MFESEIQVGVLPHNIFSLAQNNYLEEWPMHERLKLKKNLDHIFDRSDCFKSLDEDCFAKEFDIFNTTNRTKR